MAEDLDAEMEAYWKGSVEGTPPTKQTPEKKTGVKSKKRPTMVVKNNAGSKPRLDQPLSAKATNVNASRKPNQYQQKRRRRDFQHYPNRHGMSSNPFHPACLARDVPKPDPDTCIFPGKTKLFIGGLPEEYTDDQLRELMEPYGFLDEVYLPQGKSFAIVTYSSRESAYKAQRALSGKTLEGNNNNRMLRIRPSPDAAVWIGDLPSITTNELLKQAFSRFGPINRAIVCCDTRGRSLGYGLVEFAYKGSATNCIEVCTVQPFLLSRSPQPVRVEPFRYKEEDIGLPAKDILVDRFYWGMIESECNGPGPRMGDEPIAMEWLKLYQQQKIAKQALKEKFQEERKELLEKQNLWFREEEQERMRASEDIRSQRMEIMRREEQLRNSQMQLDHATAQIGYGAW